MVQEQNIGVGWERTSHITNALLWTPGILALGILDITSATSHANGVGLIPSDGMISGAALLPFVALAGTSILSYNLANIVRKRERVENHYYKNVRMKHMSLGIISLGIFATNILSAIHNVQNHEILPALAKTVIGGITGWTGTVQLERTSHYNHMIRR